MCCSRWCGNLILPRLNCLYARSITLRQKNNVSSTQEGYKADPLNPAPTLLRYGLIHATSMTLVCFYFRVLALAPHGIQPSGDNDERADKH